MLRSKDAMKLLGKLIVNMLALLITTRLVSGFVITDLKTAFIAAIVIGILNTFVKPVLRILTFPITLLTLGLFSFVLNVLLLMFAASITPGFNITGFMPAIIGSIVLSLVSAVLHLLVKDK
jgi:putative membrane protein